MSITKKNKSADKSESGICPPRSALITSNHTVFYFPNQHFLSIERLPAGW